MDLVEITLGIEEAFSVRISNDDLEGLVRDRDVAVGDLYALVLERLQLREVARYDLALNRQFWTRIRSTLHAATAAPLADIQLSSKLEALFPPATRRADWTAIQEACPHKVKELEYPRAVRPIGVLLAVTFVSLELLQVWQQPLLNWLWPLVGMVGLWMVCETYWKILAILAPLRRRLPSGMVTVKDLCRSIVADNYEHIFQERAMPSIALDDRALEVWHKLVAILADTLGIDPAGVTFRSRLVSDLGAA